MPKPAKPSSFQIERKAQLTLSKSLNKALKRQLKNVIPSKQIDDVSRRSFEGHRDALKAALEMFKVRYRLERGTLENIPCTGGLIVVSNHPLDMLESVVLLNLLGQVRDDVRVISNRMLKRVPELADLFITSPRQARDGQTAAWSQAGDWVRQGGALVVFPDRYSSRKVRRPHPVQDVPWREHLGRLAQETGVPVVPVFFAGDYDRPYRDLAGLHLRFRDFLLSRQVMRKANAILPVSLGDPIDCRGIVSPGDYRKTGECIELHTYVLGRSGETAAGDERSSRQAFAPVCEATSPDDLQWDIERLPAEQRLVTARELSVYIAGADDIPSVLREIGRLREITFRATGEGTGNETDIDRYDQHYQHLFVWNETKRELVGAYRLGPADSIVERHGRKGLYTQSLFRYRGRLLDAINPAIELGRSFVRREYQRSFAPLMLLWKGIGVFVAQNPRYGVLFGPVSISNEYHAASQRLMVECLRHCASDPRLSRLVQPRRPFKGGVVPMSAGNLDLERIAKLVSIIEPDSKGLPILLRHYLKLGGKVLGFNVDLSFNSLDGLIMVDLRQTDPRLLSKYMGTEAAEHFLAFHRRRTGLCA